MAYAPAADGVDYLATIQSSGISATKHYAQFTVKRSAGYSAPSTQEVELLLAFTLGNGMSRGYELDFWFGGTVLQPVRWNNGAALDYDFGAVTVVSGSWPNSGLVDGDVVRAVFDSTSGSPLISVYLNGALRITFIDSKPGKILSGSPGMGFFVREGQGLDLTGYAAKGFAAGNG